MELRQFTLRLSPVDDEVLEKLKKHLNEKTDSGAIRYVINDYLRLKNKADKLEEELYSTERKLGGLEYELDEFFELFNKLKTRGEK